MENNRLTPEIIANTSDLLFRIPLYQRLFEWTDEQILTLMNDLYNSYSKSSSEAYYIGMLTATRNSGRYELIDGQQRFTVLILLGIVCSWHDLLTTGESEQDMRLTFFARPKDMSYIFAQINGKKSNSINYNMQNGIRIIKDFFEKHENLPGPIPFDKYIYQHLTMFIAELPIEYYKSDINKYFEVMNSSGKSLENHEKLKVDILKILENGVNKEKYAHIWNLASQMNTSILKQRNYTTQKKTAVESDNDFFQRYKNAISFLLPGENTDSLVDAGEFFDKYWEGGGIDFKDENISWTKIGEIPARTTPPGKTPPKDDTCSSVLSFPELLLEVLFLLLNEKIGDYNKTDFFNAQKLQETFKKFQGQYSPRAFIQSLIAYRLILDFFLIKVKNDESGYCLDDFYDKDKTSDDSIIQYQSMMFVSSDSYYIWITPLLKKLRNKIINKEWICAKDFLILLKETDNEISGHTKLDLEKSLMSYGEINRYWFWRLDYFLWENRRNEFQSGENDEYVNIADKYIFRRNRSIEHIAPQTPQYDSNKDLKWDANSEEDVRIRDCFGNLAMISSSQNSSLQNQAYEIKMAYIKAFVGRTKVGSVESLKLLKAFHDNDTWSREIITKHGEAMLCILKESFPR